jgi:heme/copper-type cytochrome/quinol oxidase subunit 1
MRHVRQAELVGDSLRPADSPGITSRGPDPADRRRLGLVTWKRWWPYLWHEWITSVDHKRIGIMYMLLGVVMLIRGFADAIMMRTQQAVAIGGSQGYLPPEHYDQIFSAHGTIMIFFAAMPLVIGFMNFVTCRCSSACATSPSRR